jgi:UDP-N-acetylenolpyruvoylglucosamine reductase
MKKLFGENIRENVSMSDYTTFKIGGYAKKIYIPQNICEPIIN